MVARALGVRESAAATLKHILEADVQYCNPFQLENGVLFSGTTIVVQSNLGSKTSPISNNLVLDQVAGGGAGGGGNVLAVE